MERLTGGVGVDSQPGCERMANGGGVLIAVFPCGIGVVCKIVAKTSRFNVTSEQSATMPLNKSETTLLAI